MVTATGMVCSNAARDGLCFDRHRFLPIVGIGIKTRGRQSRNTGRLILSVGLVLNHLSVNII